MFLAVQQETLHHMIMIAVLKYSSFCELITYDFIIIKTLNFCRFCLFSYLFGLLAQAQREVLPIMTATEIDEIRKRWDRLRVCNLCGKSFQE